jgi:ATP phosphoribosyltransferase
MRTLTFALTRGRPLEQCVPLLERAGLATPGLFTGRRLIFDSPEPGLRFIVARSSDVPTYVARGAAAFGIAGKDTLLEYDEGAFYERLDLGLARCRLMVAGPAGRPMPPGRLRVATKFVHTARAWFAARGQQADVIALSGAVELAPALGLADVIVDIVETGTSLRENGLEPLAKIADISARIIVNRAAMKLEYERIGALIARIEGALADAA